MLTTNKKLDKNKPFMLNSKIGELTMTPNELSKLMKKMLEIVDRNLTSANWTLETAIFFQQRVIAEPDSFYHLISK